MRITAALPDHGAIVEAVLDGFVQAAMVMIQAGVVPPYPDDVPSVRYQEESSGSEEWLLPNQVIAKGWGDCEDLVIWSCGGDRATGADEGARAMLVQTGPGRIHCVKQRGDGSVEDVALRIRGQRMGAFALGAEVILRDHRGLGPKPPTATAPPAAASAGTPIVNPYAALEQYAKDHNYPASGGRAIVIKTTTSDADDRYGGTAPNQADSRVPYDPSFPYIPISNEDVVRQEGAGALSKLQQAVTRGARNVPVPLQMYGAGMSEADLVGDTSRSPIFGGGGKALSRSTTPTLPYYTRDPSTGQQIMYDPKSQKAYDPTTGGYYDPGGPVDPYTGQPTIYQRDPTTGEFTVDPYANDPYGGMGVYDPFQQYGAYGSPYYNGYIPDMYSQSLPGYGESGYAGWQSYGMPSPTYEDIYGAAGFTDGFVGDDGFGGMSDASDVGLELEGGFDSEEELDGLG